MNPKEQAEVVADVFQEAGWKTTEVTHHIESVLLPEAWRFNAASPYGTGDFVTIRVRPKDHKIEINGLTTWVRDDACKVLEDAGLRAHVVVKSSW